MGRYEDELRSISGATYWDIPRLNHLKQAAGELASSMTGIMSSVDWKGAAAERSQEMFELLQNNFREIERGADGVLRSIDRANQARSVAKDALGDLPDAIVPEWVAEKAAGAEDFEFFGIKLKPESAVSWVEEQLGGQREEKAQAALGRLKESLAGESDLMNTYVTGIAIKNIGDTDVPAGWPYENDDDGSGDSDADNGGPGNSGDTGGSNPGYRIAPTGGGSGAGSGGDVVTGGTYPVQPPNSPDITDPGPGGGWTPTTPTGPSVDGPGGGGTFPGSPGGGGGGGTFPNGTSGSDGSGGSNGSGSGGGLNGGGNGSGSGGGLNGGGNGSGSGGGLNGVGGGGGLGSGIAGGGAGAAALAATKLGGAGVSAAGKLGMGGAGGLGGAGAGGIGGAGGAGAGAGGAGAGARLGSGGLLGTTGSGGTAAAGGAGSGTATAAVAGGRGGTGMMGGGGGGGGGDKDKRSGMGLMAPRLEDEDDAAPRSTGASAGGRQPKSED